MIFVCLFDFIVVPTNSQRHKWHHIVEQAACRQFDLLSFGQIKGPYHKLRNLVYDKSYIISNLLIFILWSANVYLIKHL